LTILFVALLNTWSTATIVPIIIQGFGQFIPLVPYTLKQLLFFLTSCAWQVLYNFGPLETQTLSTSLEDRGIPSKAIGFLTHNIRYFLKL
jgi:hypothetical protein